jgi:hypothetical protein
MKIEERVVKVDLEFNVPTYIADDNTSIQLTNEDFIKILRSKGLEVIDNKILSKKSHCEKLDREHEFKSFTPNCTGLVYDENNKETYKHFINHYLGKYYVDSNNSTHYNNGSYWEHCKYDTEIGLHNRMLSGEFELTNPVDIGVKDLIIIHLMSGKGVRMYGTGQHYRRVRKLKTIEEQKDFWRFVFDSKMIDPNGRVEISPRMHQVLGDKRARSEAHEYKHWFKSYQTFGQLIVSKCWRDGNLEVLKWIVDEYDLDLSRADKLHSVDAIVNFSNSLFYSIVDEIHDTRIHDTYNNEILRRLYDYTSKKLNDKKKVDSNFGNISFNKFIEFVRFINITWPLLKLSSSTNYSSKENTIIEYSSLEDCMRRSIVKDKLKNSERGELESAESLILSLKTGVLSPWYKRKKSTKKQLEKLV